MTDPEDNKEDNDDDSPIQWLDDDDDSKVDDLEKDDQDSNNPAKSDDKVTDPKQDSS